MTLNELLSRLKNVRRGTNNQYTACCPAHDDKRASLCISEHNGKLLLYCHAGCAIEDIMAALGITSSDLMPERNNYAAQTTEYIYTDADGKPILKKIRTANKAFYWQHLNASGQWDKGRNNITPPLFNQYNAKGGKCIYITEGEKDVLTLTTFGKTAVSLPDGAKSKWRKEYDGFFKGRNVVILPDHDEPGKQYAHMIAEKIYDAAESVKVIDLSAIWDGMPEHSDITDYISTYGKESIQNVEELVAQTEVYEPAGPEGVTCLTSVESASSQWLWRPYIPLGKITLLTADPGTGKTFFCLYLAAAVSVGRPFFGEHDGAYRKPRNVIYQTAEDGISDTIKPRLEPMMPNFNNIFFIDETEKSLSLTDERIEAAMKAYRPALMIFDPLQAYLGADVDMHRANEVRPIMSRIAFLAEKYKCAVVLVMHNSKMGQNQALYRSLGSIDIPAIARSMLIMANSPDADGQKLICHEKSSLAAHGKSIKLRIAPERGGLLFEGFSDLKADDVLNVHAKNRNKPSVTKDEVSDKLIELLESNDGAVTMEQIEEFKSREGIKDRTLYNVKKEMGIKSVKIGFESKKTWWLMPDIDVEEFKKDIARKENPFEDDLKYDEGLPFYDDGYSIPDGDFQ